MQKVFVYNTPEQVPISSDLLIDNQLSCAVIVDVFRATTTIATALHYGAEAVQVFKEPSDLLATSKLWSGPLLLAGERDGDKLEGFDFGNSPLEFTPTVVTGKRIFMSTTNGTSALERMQFVPVLITASLTNRAAVVKFICKRKFSNVWLVNSGCNGQFSLEDNICSGAIAHSLLEQKTYIAGNDAAIAAACLFELWQHKLHQLTHQATHGIKLFTLGYAEDLAYCIKLDIIDTVPIQTVTSVLKAS